MTEVAGRIPPFRPSRASHGMAVKQGHLTLPLAMFDLSVVRMHNK